MPHTVNLGRDCCDYRMIEQGVSTVRSAVWKEMITQKTSRCRLWAAFGSDCFIKGMWERFTIKKNVGKPFAGRSSKRGAAGNRQQLAQ